MTTMTPIAEFEQQLNQALNRAVTNREELIEAANDSTRRHLREALDVVYEATSDIPAEEMDQMIQESIQASRQARNSSNVSHSLSVSFPEI